VKWPPVEANAKSALNLLLKSNVGPVTTLSLSAVVSLKWELGVTLSANHFVAFEFSGKSSKGWLDLELSHTTSSQSEDQVKGGLLLDVIVGEGSAIFKLLTGKD